MPKAEPQILSLSTSLSHVVCNGTNADGYNVVYCTLTIDLLARRGVLLGRSVIMATSFQFSPLTFHKLVREQPSSQPSRINIMFYDASCFFIIVFKAYTKIGKGLLIASRLLAKIMCSICSCQLKIWHSLAPILN